MMMVVAMVVDMEVLLSMSDAIDDGDYVDLTDDDGGDGDADGDGNHIGVW